MDHHHTHLTHTKTPITLKYSRLWEISYLIQNYPVTSLQSSQKRAVSDRKSVV